ncbi:hypothetical protein KOR42_39950 [Thalassoglobus neptunius]|uniref:Uncharacterized protein n=1 Tax=Thalassoglobus neptunius TaxID=1938619 RepID=A0A5C5WDU4_9PLAN|nr:hypothetical protein [Thalassoglobus neptunius]TWT48205.1 hypothetical protein KOR42_39950 [Thalassoglobus neptunius]
MIQSIRRKQNRLATTRKLAAAAELSGPFNLTVFCIDGFHRGLLEQLAGRWCSEPFTLAALRRAASYGLVQPDLYLGESERWKLTAAGRKFLSETDHLKHTTARIVKFRMGEWN